MTEFAVRLLTESPDKGYWVFAVDGDRLLISGEDNRLRWVEISNCVVAKAASPEMPRPVMALKQPEPIKLPGLTLNGR